METHVYANDDEFCSQAADGVAMACFPDVCHSPSKDIPLPYPNTAFARDLANGSTTVFVCGTPICKKDVSYLATSTGNEPATEFFKKGTVTHVITGKCYFVDWSPYIFQIVQTSVVTLLLRGSVTAELVDSPPRSLGLLRARARTSAQGARWWSLCSAASRMVDRTHFVFIRLGAGELL